MPSIYLSPSTQENNLYVIGGSEEYYMNLIADAMEPYLRSSGIRYTRNTPQMTASSSIRQSNQGNYDLHLALHSNAAPEGRYGTVRGTDVYYFPTSSQGRRAAEIIANGLRDIYPIPSLVRAIPTTNIGEVRLTRAPSVFIEFAYHDNEADANWIVSNIEGIAANVVASLTRYFGIPFIAPINPFVGTVNISSGYLNIRDRPSLTSPIIGRAFNGDELIINGVYENWYVVDYNGIIGYVRSDFVSV